jgi:hypothetical protein
MLWNGLGRYSRKSGESSTKTMKAMKRTEIRRPNIRREMRRYEERLLDEWEHISAAAWEGLRNEDEERLRGGKLRLHKRLIFFRRLHELVGRDAQHPGDTD